MNGGIKMIKKYKYYVFLVLAALIWGFAFVAQRVGMKYMGPFAYNGIRFALGAISLLPLIIFQKKGVNDKKKVNKKMYILYGIIAGVLIFAGSTFQQIGLIHTEAGKSGFITDLYIVIVPIIGIVISKNKIKLNALAGALVAAVGLYFLCVNKKFYISQSDFFVFASAFFFAFHILYIDYVYQKLDSLKLAFLQYITCAFVSIVISLITEDTTIHSIVVSAVPIIYGGVFSVGIAYTLQIVGQKGVEPTSASIILSLESVFAALGGFLILNERLKEKAIVGCILMFLGIIISQMKINCTSESKITINNNKQSKC